jgi:pimeloyl-ACP methyl ester carboxylesterase
MASGTVVLVHGRFVDGSGWQGVYEHLKKDGYNVAIVQNPTLSLADDVAVTKRAIDAQSEPVILVGHSYGGAVITEAGNHPKVAALVYIAAFAPDKDESVNTLIADPPPDAPVPPILPPQDGFLFLDREKFHASFAGDVSADQAAFMADSQVPWGVDALGGTISEPAWRSKPSWYLVATEDRMIPPPAQREMSARAGSTVVEVGQPCDLRLAARRRGRTHREGRFRVSSPRTRGLQPPCSSRREAGRTEDRIHQPEHLAGRRGAAWRSGICSSRVSRPRSSCTSRVRRP